MIRFNTAVVGVLTFKMFHLLYNCSAFYFATYLSSAIFYFSCD